MSIKIAVKAYHQGQEVLFPESIDAYIAADLPVQLISRIVDTSSKNTFQHKQTLLLAA